MKKKDDKKNNKQQKTTTNKINFVFSHLLQLVECKQHKCTSAKKTRAPNKHIKAFLLLLLLLLRSLKTRLSLK